MRKILGFIGRLPLIVKIIIGFIIVVLIFILMVQGGGGSSSRGLTKIEDLTFADGENTSVLSNAELEQREYIKQWGSPPQGFRWNERGDLVALGDASLSTEDVAYSFLRSLTTLDLATSQKYSTNSTTVLTYNGYYGADASQSYYTQFLRKMYKQVLLSMETLNIKDSAVFANGTRIITFNIKALDLSNKDFWLKDKETIFNKLYTYSTTESDNTKANQYLYDYILSYYQSENALKKEIQIDIVLDKVTLGGWLVSDDKDINMICSYAEGDIVTSYIQQQFSIWLNNKSKGVVG